MLNFKLKLAQRDGGDGVAVPVFTHISACYGDICKRYPSGISTKKAFTMIELVMIIVVVGIIAAAAIPRFSKNPLIEATHQIVSHIRYTQNLAMIYDTYNPNDPVWYKRQWGIWFNNLENEWRYSVCRITTDEISGGCNSPTGIATDPARPARLLSGGYHGKAASKALSPNLNLSNKYDIVDVKLEEGCAGRQNRGLFFDHFGRPLFQINAASNTSPAKNLVRTDCLITITNSAGEFATIRVLPETGLVSIDKVGVFAE